MSSSPFRPIGSGSALRTGPGPDQMPSQADLARMVGQKLVQLFAIQLDDQLLVDGQVDLGSRRDRNDATLQIFTINLQPGRTRLMAGELAGGRQNRQLAALFAHCDLVTHVYFIRWDVDLATVDLHVSMAHQLPRLAPRNGKSHAVDDVVEPALKLLQEHFAGDGLRARCLFEVVAELTFLGEEDSFGLLLFAQLQAIPDDLRFAIFPVLAGSEITLLDRALIAETFCPFEEQLHALAAAQTTYCIFVTCQVVLLYQIGLQELAPLRSRSKISNQYQVPGKRSQAPLVLSSCLREVIVDWALSTRYYSHPAAFRWTAAIVRNRGDVANGAHLDAGGRQSANRRLASRTRPAHSHFHAAQPVIARHIGCVRSSLLRGKRCALPRSTEAQRTRALPRNHISIGIGNRDNGVVEGRLNVHNPVRDVLALLLLEGLLLAFFLRCCCAGACCGCRLLSHRLSLRR